MNSSKLYYHTTNGSAVGSSLGETLQNVTQVATLADFNENIMIDLNESGIETLNDYIGNGTFVARTDGGYKFSF